jgi:hypothetical protein
VADIIFFHLHIFVVTFFFGVSELAFTFHKSIAFILLGAIVFMGAVYTALGILPIFVSIVLTRHLPRPSFALCTCLARTREVRCGPNDGISTRILS